MPNGEGYARLWLKTPLASLIAAMMFSTVSALAAEITADEVEAMPFVKAWVYAGAIDQFCSSMRNTRATSLARPR